MRLLLSKKLCFVSKPRCGSTSIRRALDPLINPALGDIAVDFASKDTAYHPHMPATLIKRLLQQTGIEDRAIEFVITVRHPLNTLESYYSYFKPDFECRYSYEVNWDGTRLLPFYDWLMEGRIGMRSEWGELCPSWVNGGDFSPISFEALAHDAMGQSVINQVFRIEQPELIERWLSEYLGIPGLKVDQLNRSERQEMSISLTSDVKKRIRKCFPFESKIYDI